MTAFPDNCTCHWVRNEDGRPECEVGRECSCLHHCWCEDQSRLDCGGAA